MCGSVRPHSMSALTSAPANLRVDSSVSLKTISWWNEKRNKTHSQNERRRIEGVEQMYRGSRIRVKSLVTSFRFSSDTNFDEQIFLAQATEADTNRGRGSLQRFRTETLQFPPPPRNTSAALRPEYVWVSRLETLQKWVGELQKKSVDHRVIPADSGLHPMTLQVCLPFLVCSEDSTHIFS